MSLSVGIVGLPNVGKSTLFNALTRQSVPAENYPFCTIDPSVGLVPLPDERLRKLSEFSKSKKTVPAIVQFVDIAGLVAGASKGEGLGNQFLSHIRETDMILEVVRAFKDENVIHVSNSVDPLRDAGVIDLELILADFETVTKRIANLGKDAKRGVPEAVKELSALEEVAKLLEAGRSAREGSYDAESLALIKGLHLISMKPVLYVLNTKGEPDQALISALVSSLDERGLPHIVVDIKTEADFSALSEQDEQELRESLGALETGLARLVAESYRMLGLITFFTTGEDETRGWTITRGSTAPEAGAAIHTDFRERFIKADVIEWQKLLECGSYARARELGHIRTEGKTYVVNDGDVIEFKV